MSFSADSEILVGACNDGVVRLWDADSGAEIDALQGPSMHVSSVSFSPDGKTLAATGGEVTDEVYYGVVYLWDVATWTEIAVIRKRDRSNAIMSFGPDSNTLAYFIGDSNTVHLWDIAAGTEKPGFTIINSVFKPRTFQSGWQNARYHLFLRGASVGCCYAHPDKRHQRRT